MVGFASLNPPYEFTARQPEKVGTAMIRRIVPDRCWAAIIDVQEFFLSAVADRRSQIETNTANLARLLGCFGIPIVATLERPLDQKGLLPAAIKSQLKGHAEFFEKDFFDLTREKTIRNYLRRLKKKQAVLAGCETDVCVLQSCLGLLDLGHEVYVVEDLLFSASSNVGAAIERMKNAGAVFLTYKTLYYELTAAVDGAPLPDDLPDAAV
jgi:nicotinamidase-related amidase